MSEVVRTVVFAAEPGGGNPAPVVFAAGSLGAERMLRIAGGFGVETVFVSEPVEGSAASHRLRFFTPRHEMEMCVHGIVGALCALAHRDELRGQAVAVETALGPIRATCSARPRGLWAWVEQRRPRFDPTVVSPRDVAAVLRVTADAIDWTTGPVQAVSTARPKLMVPLASADVLDSLEPDFEALWEACARWRVTGLYPFTVRGRDASYDAEARQFPLRAGYDEDAATGVAACALGAYLIRHEVFGPAADGWYGFRIGQGRALGRPSVMHARGRVARGAVVTTGVGGGATVDI